MHDFRALHIILSFRLCFLERVGPGPPLDSSRQDRDEGDSVEWEELTVVKRTLQSVKQSLQALQQSLNTKPPQC